MPTKKTAPAEAEEKKDAVIEAPKGGQAAPNLKEEAKAAVAEAEKEAKEAVKMATVAKTAAKAIVKKAPAQTSKPTVLTQATAVLNKVFKEEGGADAVRIDEDTYRKSLPHLPSGSTVIDYLIGGKPNRYGIRPCPGFPRGRIINLYGHESSGKTTLALTLAAETCRNGGTVCYIDWENCIDIAYSKALGVPINDPNRFVLLQPPTLEKGIGSLWTMVRAGVDLIVIDSIGAAIPKVYREQKLEEKGETSAIGLVARIWSQFVPQLQEGIARSGSCVLAISQLRKKINTSGYGGDDTTTQGGEVWKFFSAIKMRLARISTEKGSDFDVLTRSKKDLTVGSIIKAKIDKCKVAASQGRDANFYIRFGEGIDDVRSIVEIASSYGIVKKGGAWLAWERANGEAVKFQGMEAFKKYLKKAPDAWEELKKSTLDTLATVAPESIPDEAPEEGEAALREELGHIMTGGKQETPTE